mmetsp:Transcript_96524/g.229825  ORF Transcript_96524/g.229825 Transcript_96524/m.229825 type:complete len:263 (+) Transcript_96524:604-1392(+)
MIQEGGTFWQEEPQDVQEKGQEQQPLHHRRIPTDRSLGTWQTHADSCRKQHEHAGEHDGVCFCVVLSIPQLMSLVSGGSGVLHCVGLLCQHPRHLVKGNCHKVFVREVRNDDTFIEDGLQILRTACDKLIDDRLAVLLIRFAQQDDVLVCSQRGAHVPLPLGRLCGTLGQEGDHIPREANAMCTARSGGILLLVEPHLRVDEPFREGLLQHLRCLGTSILVVQVEVPLAVLEVDKPHIIILIQRRHALRQRLCDRVDLHILK